MSEDFDDDAYRDAALISRVGSAFDTGRPGHDPRDVLARGRQLRRRKRAMPAFGALGVAAASMGLALALTGASGNNTALNVDNAAFSVHTDAATGKVTVTLRQYFDENELKQILAKAGIRAIFAAEPTYAVGAHQVDIGCTWPGVKHLNPVGVLQTTANTAVIDPSKMPDGSVIAFVYGTIDNDKNDKNGKKASFVSETLLANKPTTGCGQP